MWYVGKCVADRLSHCRGSKRARQHQLPTRVRVGVGYKTSNHDVGCKGGREGVQSTGDRRRHYMLSENVDCSLF